MEFRQCSRTRVASEIEVEVERERPGAVKTPRNTRCVEVERGSSARFLPGDLGQAQRVVGEGGRVDGLDHERFLRGIHPTVLDLEPDGPAGRLDLLLGDLGPEHGVPQDLHRGLELLPVH